MRDDWRSTRNITIGALLAAMAVGIQASPLFLPVVGISLSSLSTLPVAVSGYLNPLTGLLTYLISSVILAMWSVPQAIIFFFSSGLLGLTMGALMKKRVSFVVLVGISGLFLSMGVFLVGKFLGVVIFPWLIGAKRVLLLPVILACSLLYTVVWVPVLSALLHRLRHLLT